MQTLRTIIPLRTIAFAAICVAFIASCNHQPHKIPAVQQPVAFDSFSHHFIEAFWKEFPGYATQNGYHAWDTVLKIPGKAQDNQLLAFVQAERDSLSQFDTASLPDAARIDYKIIANQLEDIKWQIEKQHSDQWNPGTYNVIETFALILNEHYAPLPDRLRAFYARLQHIPEYYAAARANLKDPVKELTDLTIDQLNGGVSVIEKDFGDSLKSSGIPAAEQQLMIARAIQTADTIKAFAAWLKSMDTTHARSFRLGKDLYEAKFRYEQQSAYTAEEIYDSAIRRKQYIHTQMLGRSRQLWPKYFGNKPMPSDSLAVIGMMIDTLSVQHVAPDSFQSAISALIPKLTAFVKEKNLVYIDPSKPLIIRKEPAYMAGVAGASINAPGPYDKEGNTYYNVGSLAGWPKEKAESYLREYNNYLLQILCIHEAIPGHYTQLVYANQSPSLIKTIFGNNAMIEGWAVYTEQMMLDNGYGNDSPELWLMWYKWHLRSVCNTILDYSVHAGNMTRDEALHMLTKEAFQQQAEAEGKWKRVSVTSVQLTSYYTGYKEITDLREAWKAKMGAQYTLRGFNEKFLSYGSAPVKYIRELMLGK